MTLKSMKPKNQTIALPKALIRRLKQAAKQQNRSLTSFTALLLDSALLQTDLVPHPPTQQKNEYGFPTDPNPSNSNIPGVQS